MTYVFGEFLCCLRHSNAHRIPIPYGDGTLFAQTCSKSCGSLPDFLTPPVLTPRRLELHSNT